MTFVINQNTVMSRYQELVASGNISQDPAQLEVINRLDQLNLRLAEKPAAQQQSFFSKLFSKNKKEQDITKGVYIWGSVGRGKTMLMDLFFDLAPTEGKIRSHFHEFMEDIHNRMKQLRAEISEGKRKDTDPVLPVADAVGEGLQLLCFDEFTITDIADAMLIGRLFSRLFEHGVVVVATSNVEPDNLYKDGLNRSHILPFIDMIKQQVDVVCLDSSTDYRLEKLGDAEVYLSPLGPQADQDMANLWASLTYGLPAHSETLHNKGRNIAISKTASGVAWFTFDELCAQPLGASDYLRIAHAYHTIFLEAVPALNESRRNEAKRFINLIDTLYDNKNKLVIMAAAQPQELYQAKQGTEAFEFDRTASRLIEMRSSEYLSQRNDSPN
ncbi:cell division protein ZapE [Polycladidibacter stylochi]|uniref:cell division protein ZapE n=1 Tax=Polycladidibacter stylochi TaxID=1807766 RepID=UPI00082D95A6|nr:cell division protein ZapE [Pseudovibrio stylochi]